MAEKCCTKPKEVESTVEEVEKMDKSKEEEASVEKDEVKSKNGGKAENGDEKKAEDAEEEEEEEEENGADATDKCSIKRKSTGDAAAETPAEGATPEKKTKLDETVEAPESNGAEVAA